VTNPTTSPLPPRILAALDGDTATLAELSAHLNITDARLRWHLRRMLDAGQVDVRDEHWALTPDGARQRETLDVGQQGAIPPHIIERFEQAFAECGMGLYGTEIVQQSGEHGSRMSTEQAAEFAERLKGLIAEYFAPGRGDHTGTKYGLHWVLTPVDLHPLADS
jgi:hypothetical protein